jgi:hypothetical protein
MASACAAVVLAPVTVLPGWVSITLVAAGSGLAMLLAVKYTSNQRAVGRVRRDIKADLLALSLFRDSWVVSLKSQGRVLAGAGRLLMLAIPPILLMFVPVSMLLAQLALWYQARPLEVGEEAVVTVHLATDAVSDLADVRLAPCSAIEVMAGPVRVAARRMICWNVQARAEGYYRLTFEACGQTFDKELAVGGGFMRVSPHRPGWDWMDAALSPGETPLPTDCVAQAIDVAYPERRSWTSGSNSWLPYWFATSMVFAFAMRPLLKVSL